MLLERWKEPAWEDLAPWRPPETDTQEEDPGSDLEFAMEYGGIFNAGIPPGISM